jgi:16S rRNA G527 N7-methylase RsmG
MNLVGSTDPAAMSRTSRTLAAVPHLPQDATVVDLGSGLGSQACRSRSRAATCA